VYRGFLVVGPDLATFMVCETFETAWVRNGSGEDLLEIHRSLGAKEYAPIYTELRGAYEPAPPEIVRDGFDVVFTLTELRRAYPGGEGPDCSENLAFVFRAFGNEPFWSVKISGTGIAVTRPDDAEPPWFPLVEPMLEPSATRYISRKGERTIDVVVRAGRCRDTMSGAYFNLSAEMQLDGRTYVGCAVRGTE
jgi:putative lipoprotein